MFLYPSSSSFRCRLEVLVVSYLDQSSVSPLSALACMAVLFSSSEFGQVSLGVEHSQFARVFAEMRFGCRPEDDHVDLYVCFIQISIEDWSCLHHGLLFLIFEK